MSRLRQLENLIKKQVTLTKLPSVADLKAVIVKKDLDNMSVIIDKVKEKGTDFRLDDTFDDFKSRLDGLDREEVLRALFTWKYKDDLRRYDKLGTLDVDRKTPVRSRSVGGARGNASRTSGARPEREGRNKQTRKLRNPNNIRLFMNAGTKDGLKLRDFVDSFSKQSGISQNEINNVSFKDSYGFVEVPNTYGNKIVGKSFKFNERNTHFEYAN